MRALILALALAACSPEAPAPTTTEAPQTNSVENALAQMPSWDGARAAGVDFRAVGQEPGWMLDIYTADRIRIIWDYGEQSAELPLTEPAYPQEGVTRYESRADGRTLTATIRRSPCQDSMSGEAFPASVEVTIDGRTLTGCGRSV
jgi:putative lipoprotein